ncbi:MAG: 30S ribosomal protein S4 [Archaeoglobaceae archaeon]|nr:30S ribosomal protein S4 [Archaeoglobaceae archaeon]MCX8151848.1 30S ribosomal protein S4 [Archaeoglobaceae archaeon]MDW8014320.1 30S ribosomal protein S4 [Archaeoglobaceae archaeon]
MGDPKRCRKKYVTPTHPWDRARLEKERELVIKYGLRNKRELWRFQNILRKYRRVARDLLGKINLQSREGDIARKIARDVIEKLNKVGVLHENATLDDILNLRVEDFLERRLQTLVHRLGLAKTIKEARQLITHGHIAVGGRKVTAPSFVVPKDLESTITYYKYSPLNKEVSV